MQGRGLSRPSSPVDCPPKILQPSRRLPNCARRWALTIRMSVNAGQVRRAQGLLQRYAPAAGSADTGAFPASANSRVAGGFGDLPPSANGVSPKPQITRQALPQSGNPGFQPGAPPQPQASAPIGAGSTGGPALVPGRPQGGAPISAAPGGAPQQPPQPQQPQGGPITPIPNDPRTGRPIQSAQQAQEVWARSINGSCSCRTIPTTRRTICLLEHERERIETAIAPVNVTPSTTRLNPFTGQPLYQSNQPSMSADAGHNAAERYLETGQLPPKSGSRCARFREQQCYPRAGRRTRATTGH